MGERSSIQIAVWAVAALLLGFAGSRLLGPSSRDTAAVRLDPPRPEGANRGQTRLIYVHVAGAVRRPGLIRVPAAARVAVAVRRAGGAARGADLTAVNLAARLHDGEQVVVPQPGSAGASGGQATVASAGAPKLGLGNATTEQLDSLDGIGPKLAQRILGYRQAHGGFRSLEQLREVDGIGDKRFAALKKALRP